MSSTHRPTGEVLPIQWHEFHTWDDWQTPFDTSDETARYATLQLTFDDRSLESPSGPNEEALDLLRGFAAKGLVDGLGTEPSEIPHLVVTGVGAQMTVRRSDEDWERGPWPFGVPGEEEVKRSLSTLYSGDPSRPEVADLSEPVMRLQPHLALRRDILVSLDGRLLEHRRHPLIARFNVRTPVETAQIVGLFLRSRSNYIYRASAVSTEETDRVGLFNELAQMRLGPYWRLHFAHSVSNSDHQLSDEARLDLSWSVVSRVAKAFQALDEVGVIYYGSTKGWGASDRARYHFDYGLLLLNGALDALLRLGQQLVGISKRARPSFTDAKYLNRLEEAGAIDVAETARRPETQAVIFLLTQLRNLIHEREPRLAPVSDGVPSRPDRGLGIQAPYGIAIRLWCAAGQVGPVGDFGLTVNVWGRLIKNGVEDLESERFAVTVGLYPYLRSLTHAIAGLLGELAEGYASLAVQRGILTNAQVDDWAGTDRGGRRRAVELLGQ